MARAENRVEKYLHERFKQLGGTTRKWTSPGRDGVPDRICFLPGNHIVFVEVKTMHGRLTLRQEREMNTLRHLGCDCHVVYGTEGVDELMKLIVRRYDFT